MLLRLLMTALLLTAAAGSAADLVKELPIKISSSTGGDFSLDAKNGIGTYSNGVVVTYENAVLKAETVTLNYATGAVEARGAVTLQRDAALWRGEALRYNFRTRQIEAENFRAGLTPFMIQGEGLSANPGNNFFVGTNAIVTTDDISNPAYRIRAKHITLVPNDYIEVEDAVAYLGDVPVFYYPRLRRHLGWHKNNFVFTPGYRSTYGPYLLTELNSYWSSNLQSTLRLDYRVKRGVAGGPGINYDLGPAGSGSANYYYAHDLKPGTNIYFGNTIPTSRDRFEWLHDATLATNLTAKLALNYQSDPFVARDFFEYEYQRNSQPPSFLELQKTWSNFSLNALAQPQINSFFETVERLPDLKLTGARQQLGISPFYYESESSLGWFRHNFSSTPDFEAWRGDTFQQLLLPQNYFGWLNVTPRVGGRFTHYGETTGFGSTQRAEDRWVFNTGAEVSTKASRVWPAATNTTFAIDGLRHILEPAVNYSYVPSPDTLPPQLPQFDTELPSIRPVPIDFPDYNSIDSIDSVNSLRFGLRNKLQTHRKGQVENVIDWNIFTDWRLSPRVTQTTFSDLFSDLDVRPFSWMLLTSELRANFNQVGLKEANHLVHFDPSTRWSLTLGHRYFREDPLLGANSGHNLIEARVYFRPNENWGLRSLTRYEMRNGQLEEQSLTFYRDLRSWTGALTLRTRQGEGQPADYAFAFTFSLKAFPRYGLGRDRDNPRSLLGY